MLTLIVVNAMLKSRSQTKQKSQAVADNKDNHWPYCIPATIAS